MKLKVGVIGTGKLGGIHTKLWSENENADLVGIFDPDNDRASELSSQFGIKAFDSIEDLLDNIEAITIASPTIYHFDIAKQCIESGKHCLIEKPITHKYKEAEELISIANKNDVVIQVGHVERFNPALAAIKDQHFSPLFIEAHRMAQFVPRAIDVSVIHDLMIHDIDIMLSLVPSKVKDVIANGVAVLTDTPDICNARITFENGAVANLTASRISATPMRKMRLFQNNSYTSIDFGKPDVEVFTLFDEGHEFEDGKQPTAKLGSIEAGLRNKNIFYNKPEVPKLNAIAEEQNAFIKSIKQHSNVAVSAEDAAEALRIAEIISEQI